MHEGAQPSRPRPFMHFDRAAYSLGGVPVVSMVVSIMVVSIMVVSIIGSGAGAAAGAAAVSIIGASSWAVQAAAATRATASAMRFMFSPDGEGAYRMAPPLLDRAQPET